MPLALLFLKLILLLGFFILICLVILAVALHFISNSCLNAMNRKMDEEEIRRYGRILD